MIMPSNPLLQVEQTLTQMNTGIAFLRQNRHAPATREAATALIADITQVISQSIQSGLNASPSNEDKKNFLKKLALRVHPDKLIAPNNSTLRMNLEAVTIGGESIILINLPQTILNAIPIEQEEPVSTLYTRIADAATRLYHQIMHEYHRYPEPWKDYIQNFYLVMTEARNRGLIYNLFPLFFPDVLTSTLDIMVAAWLIFGLTRFLLQYLYANEAQRTTLYHLGITPFTTRSFALIHEILYDKLTAPFSADASYLEMGLSILLRLCQAIVAPIFLMAAAGEWLFFNAAMILYLPMLAIIDLSLALLINTPLYAMDLFNAGVSYWNASATTAPSPRARNHARFFAEQLPVQQAANHDERESYRNLMDIN